MKFEELLAQVLAVLRRQGRVSYLALKSRFALGAGALESLKAEPIQAKRLSRGEDGAGLAWVGETTVVPYTPKHLTDTVFTHRSALEGEYKYVTVLFADLQDSTRLAQAVGPQVMHELLDGLFRLMLEEVHRVEGTVNQFTGDGIMALFGAPIAHEDHAVRALHAALGIQRAFAMYADDLRRARGISLALRLGLHAGPVVVGKIGNHLRMDYTAQGFTTHLANRLQKLAPAGAIYLSKAVQHLAMGCCRFEYVGAFTLPGIREPVRIYECTGLDQATSRFRAARYRGWSTFVGRQAETTLLHTLWGKACQAQGQVVCLVAEAGVGKSRLAYEFQRSLTPANTLEVQSLPYGHAMPYHAFVPLLRTLLGVAGHTDPQQSRQHIRTGLSAINPTLADHEPLLADLLGIPLDAESRPCWSPEEQKHRLQHTCLQVMLHQALDQPLCLLVEDVQWLDGGSHELLELLVASLAQRPILLLATARPGYQSSWSNRSDLYELRLTPLGEELTDVFVHHWCWPYDASPVLKTLIRERTEGNPLFIEETLRALQEHDVLTIQEGQYGLKADQDVQIPSSIYGLLAARIDRLDADLKEIVQIGAVCGREFPLWLLEAVLPFRDLPDKLAALEQAQLIYEKPAQPETTYVFKHALTREVAYGSLLDQVKKRLHGAITQALEERYRDRIDEQVHVLHHHCSLAEQWPKAVRYGRQAAQRAHRLSQCHEAVTLFEQTLSCLLHLPQDRIRQETLIDLRLAMIWSLRNVGQPDQMLAVCRQAEYVAHALADRMRLGKVFLGYGNSYAYKGKFTQAEAAYQQALAYLEGSAEEALIDFAKYGLAVAYQARGQWQKAEPFFTESIRTQEAHHTQLQYPDWEVGVLPYAYSCAALAYNLALQGRIREAKALLHKGYTPAVEQVANLFTKTYSAIWHSRFAALMGEDHGALARAEEVVALTEATDSSTFRFHGYLAHGTALLAVEQYEAARGACARALQAIAGTSHGDGLGLVYFDLAWASLALGDQAAAVQYYQARRRQTPRCALLHAQILASGHPPDVAQAEACFEQSIQGDEAAGAVVLAAQTRFYLAQMLIRQGERERARTLLTTLSSQFRDWDIPVWQHKCAQELAALRPVARHTLQRQLPGPVMSRLREWSSGM